MENNSFDQYPFSSEIILALRSLNYEKPTKVQEQVIPLAINEKDLIVRSLTGSGKTAAFTIPICEKVDWLENKPQALVLTPTRELAVQVKEEFTNIGRLKRIKAAAVYGRQPIAIQTNELKQKTHVVVGTPGRILDHMEKGTINLSKVKYLVLDEADEMLRMGFLEQVEGIIINLPSDRVTMLFSATMPEQVINLAQRFLHDPVAITVEESKMSVDKIEHFLYQITEAKKSELLLDIMIMENPDSCIIFCNTKERVDDLFDKISEHGYPCGKIHGGLEQKDRMNAITSFRRGQLRYLIATDIVARGIDIEDVPLIINYEMPQDKTVYIHRTGRTGRAGLGGKAISLTTAKEEGYIKELEEYLGFSIPILTLPNNEEVSEKRQAFITKMKQEPILKIPKGDQLNKQIMKLRFSGGKNKKLRATNFVGVISNLEGITAEDIGIISVQASLTYIEILNGKGPLVLEAMKNTPIGGKLLKVSETKIT